MLRITFLLSKKVGADRNIIQDVEQLRAYLQAKLPAYMLPDFFIAVEALPLTANGKIDRKTLTDRKVVLRSSAPQNVEADHDVMSGPVRANHRQLELEKEVLALWRDVLKIDDLNISDGFFEVGGNSLLAVILAERISQSFNIIFKASLLFKYVNIQQISHYLMTETRTGDNKDSDVKSDTRVGINTRVAIPSASSPSDHSRHPDYYQDSVAIIGMSCQFPGAKDHRAFWENLKAGKESARFLSAAELRAANVPETLINNPHYVPLQLAIEDKSYFDPLFFNISPKNAALMDPQFRQLLLHSWQAVEDAGYVPKAMPETGVFMSASNSYYQTLLNTSQSVGESDEYVAWLLSQGGTIPTMVSYELGFKGPSVFVHTNCSSSLVALASACKSLHQNEVEYAVVGAATIAARDNVGYVYQPGLNFSSDGHCKTFDAAADGLIGGEGVAVIVVKKALAAINDGDHIYALVRGVAVNNDGADKAGFYAPSTNGQADVIQKALAATGIDPSSIDYVEAHGTGTKLGDPIEVAALTEVYRRYTTEHQYCALGSVKPNIGHMDTAAGLAGCIKVALSLQHGLIPPSINYHTPNPEIDFERSPFYVVDQLKTWTSTVEPRRAALSSFGIGGTNAHAILEEYSAPVAPASPLHSRLDDDRYLIPLSAKNDNRLYALGENLLAFLDGTDQDSIDIERLTYTLQIGREAMTSRVMFVCQTIQQLAEQLQHFVERKGSSPDYFKGLANKVANDDIGFLTDDEDSRLLINTWLSKNKYEQLAKFWVKGGHVDWSLLYRGRLPQRISLPTYPFAKERYWPEAAAADTVKPAPANAGQLHPLLHQNTSTGFDIRFSSEFSGKNFFQRSSGSRTKSIAGRCAFRNGQGSVSKDLEPVML